MMRTLLLVILMVLLALVAGLSFVLPAAAQGAPSAELEVGCGLDVASRETVLVSCRAVARNTGAAPLAARSLSSCLTAPFRRPTLSVLERDAARPLH